MLELREPLTADELEIARALFREYRATITAAVCLKGFDDEVRALPGEYATPRGLLLIAWLDGRPVGCAALRALDDSRAELKRLYVRPEARGYAIGRTLVERILSEARARGYRTLLLDTLPSMQTAQRLYEALGFRDCPRWDGAPADERRFMSRAL